MLITVITLSLIEFMSKVSAFRRCIYTSLESEGEDSVKKTPY